MTSRPTPTPCWFRATALYAALLLVGCAGEPTTPSSSEQAASSGDEVAAVNPAPAPGPRLLSEDELDSLRSFRADLEARARGDYEMAEALAEIPAAAEGLRADPYAALDYAVRHAVPFVLEYVYPSFDEAIAEDLRLPRELVRLPPIRDAASCEPARHALVRLANLAHAETARRLAALEAFEEAAAGSPSSDEQDLQRVFHSHELVASAQMAAFLEEELSTLVDPERTLQLRPVLYVVLGLIEVASANDFDGEDTATRAASEALRVLRLIHGATLEQLDAPALRVTRVMARE